MWPDGIIAQLSPGPGGAMTHNSEFISE